MDDYGPISAPSRPSTMPSPPSTRPSDSTGRRSFAFAHEDSGRPALPPPAAAPRSTHPTPTEASRCSSGPDTARVARGGTISDGMVGLVAICATRIDTMGVVSCAPVLEGQKARVFATLVSAFAEDPVERWL